ncbi:MAG: hypothetical protein ACPGJS_13945 [Flammeovirgaceae bacterium]
MNALKRITTRQIPVIHALDQKWLLNQPWLWETRIHYVLAFTIPLNVSVFLLALFTKAYGVAQVVGGVFSVLGFCYWIYNLWQFSLEQDRGKTGDYVAQKRFGIYFLSVLLFTLPFCLPDTVNWLIHEGYGLRGSNVILMNVGAFFASAIGAVLIQIWKQIHTKLFILTVVANALLFVGFAILVSLSSFFIVLLVAVGIFSFPMLISLITDAPKIKKFSNWKVIALASIQFYAPFLLSFVISLFMIPFSQLFSGFVFLIGLGIAAFSYIAYVLPTFRQMHIHMQSLPR